MKVSTGRIVTLKGGEGGWLSTKRCSLKLWKDADRKRLFCLNVSTLLSVIVHIACIAGEILTVHDCFLLVEGSADTLAIMSPTQHFPRDVVAREERKQTRARSRQLQMYTVHDFPFLMLTLRKKNTANQLKEKFERDCSLIK